jgi:hypothetical protein
LRCDQRRKRGALVRGKRGQFRAQTGEQGRGVRSGIRRGSASGGASRRVGSRIHCVLLCGRGRVGCFKSSRRNFPTDDRNPYRAGSCDKRRGLFSFGSAERGIGYHCGCASLVSLDRPRRIPRECGGVEVHPLSRWWDRCAATRSAGRLALGHLRHRPLMHHDVSGSPEKPKEKAFPGTGHVHGGLSETSAVDEDHFSRAATAPARA